MKNKAAIFGGSFNPIHIGHLSAALNVCEIMKLNCIYFIPNNYPVHKDVIDKIDANERLYMVKQAIIPYARFSCLDLEIIRRGPSYMIDTVKEFYRLFPDVEKPVGLIIGEDLISGLEKWERIHELTDLVQIIAITRNNGKQKIIDSIYNSIIDKYRIIQLPVIRLDISSRLIRQRYQDNLDNSLYLPESINNYILKKRFYQKDNKF